VGGTQKKGGAAVVDGLADRQNDAGFSALGGVTGAACAAGDRGIGGFTMLRVWLSLLTGCALMMVVPSGAMVGRSSWRQARS